VATPASTSSRRAAASVSPPTQQVRMWQAGFCEAWITARAASVLLASVVAV
jgi:hypothetical protein